MNGQTLSLRRRVYNRGCGAGVAVRRTDLRPAGIFIGYIFYRGFRA